MKKQTILIIGGIVLAVLLIYGMNTLEMLPKTYKTADEVLQSSNDVEYITGEITNTEFEGGAIIVTVDDAIDLHLGMSTEHSGEVLTGEITEINARIYRNYGEWFISDIYE